MIEGCCIKAWCDSPFLPSVCMACVVMVLNIKHLKIYG